MNFPQLPTARRYTQLIAAGVVGALVTTAIGALILSTITPPAPPVATEQRISVQRDGPDDWFRTTTSSRLTSDTQQITDADIGESVLPLPENAEVTIRIEERTGNGEWVEKTSALRFGHDTE